MVDILSMVDLTSISAILAAIGVFVGVVFAILQLRDLAKTRRMDTLVRLYSIWGSEGLQKAWIGTVLPLEFEDYNDFVRKYGPLTSGGPINVAFSRVSFFWHGIGVLLCRKLADIELVDDLFGYGAIFLWEKLKPIIEGFRKDLNLPKSVWGFEYLYDEMKKRERQTVKYSGTP